MLSVCELIFRGKDRIRPSWRVFSVVGLVLIVRAIIGHVGVVGLCLLAGLTAAVVGLGIGAARRGGAGPGSGRKESPSAGASGGVVEPFLGRRSDGSTSWESSGAHLGCAARITLANGRRLRLPALASTSAYPQPTFPEDFRRVVAWWEFSTDPAARFQPRLTLRTRLAPYMPGVTIALLIVVGVVIAQVVQT